MIVGEISAEIGKSFGIWRFAVDVPSNRLLPGGARIEGDNYT